MKRVSVCFGMGVLFFLVSACSSNPTIAPSSVSTAAFESYPESSEELQINDMSENTETVEMIENTIEPIVSTSPTPEVTAIKEEEPVSLDAADNEGNDDVVLPNAIQAYVDYENAKNRDNQRYYDEIMLEALKAIDYGLTSGKVGTEEFEYAVKLIVPDSVYMESHDAGDVDGKMTAIHDYCDADPIFANWFTVNEATGELSIAMENIEAFIDDAISAGAFIGDKSNFVLNDQVVDLSGFVDLMNQNLNGQGVTESTVLAMLSLLEDYDGTWDNILDDLSVPSF